MKLNAAGEYIPTELSEARTLVWQHISVPDLTSEQERELQHQLVELFRSSLRDGDRRFTAELCLRCYISNQIVRCCHDLEAKSGYQHDFTRHDLLPLVLDDVDPTQSILDDSPSNAYQPLAAEILRSFDPDKGSLATWTTKLTYQRPEMTAFLLEHGLYCVSDWSLLNHTTLEQLRRILAHPYCLSAHEIERACCLLNAYHEVYRADRRQAGAKGKCLPPTEAQLNRIKDKSSLSLSLKDLMRQLLNMAQLLREYYISIQRGSPPGNSIEHLEIQRKAEQQQLSKTNLDDSDNQTDFVERYRKQFKDCLDEAIKQEICDRQAHLQRYSPQKVPIFIPALRLYYCKGVSMVNIASRLGLNGQWEVTRLLKVDEFRRNIRHKTLKCLQGCIVEIAREYAHPDQLQHLDEQVEAALNAHLDQVIIEPSIRANAAERRRNLFIQRLCYIIKQFFRSEDF
jgi:hypothetical protein